MNKIFDFFRKNKNVDYESTLKNNGIEHFNKNIKILVIADTHGDLYLKKELVKELKSIKEYDICCILGDIHDNDYQIILDIVPSDKIVGLLGNHDRFGLLNEKGIRNINGQIVEVNGIKIAGIQGSNKYKDENYPSFTHKESIEFIKRLPHVDILISHDKPFILDNKDPAHDGLKGITKYLYEERVPINIHGHIHKKYKSNLKNGTTIKGVYKIELIEIQNGEII